MKRLAGFLILLIAIGGFGGYQYFANSKVTIKCAISGDKSNLFKDEDFKKSLSKREWGITVQDQARSSLGMVDGNLKDWDCYWPTDELTIRRLNNRLDAEKEKNKVLAEGDQFLLYDDALCGTYQILLSWREIGEALVKSGYARKISAEEKSVYSLDGDRFLEAVDKGLTWKELGLPYTGPVTFMSADPFKSSSGVTWAATVAGSKLRRQTDSKYQTFTTENIERVFPAIERIVDVNRALPDDPKQLMGRLLSSSPGASPLVVIFEKQFVEFVVENQDKEAVIQSRLAVIYMEPTVFVQNPMITTTDAGHRLATALQTDQEILDILVQKRGCRIGLEGVQRTSDVLRRFGLPEEINSVVGLPSYSVVETLLRLFSKK